jgi:UDP-glucose 4-epimerase
LRYPNVYGPRQNPNGEAGVVAIFSGKMLAGNRVTINGDGEQQRDFVHVSDCARANILALNIDKDHHIYNLGSGHGTSINEIYTLLSKITGYKKKAQFGPAKIGETHRIYLNADKARQDLGWQQTIPLEKGLEDTVNYYRVTE